jgi:hypothetical protein
VGVVSERVERVVMDVNVGAEVDVERVLDFTEGEVVVELTSKGL